MIETIIYILLIILIGLLTLKVLKGIIAFKIFFRILILISIAILIFFGSFTYLVIKDASDFKKKIASEKNLIIILNKDNSDKEEQIISIFELENKTYSKFKDFKFIKDSYTKYEFTNINDQYYKIFLINIDVLDFIKEVELKELNTKLTGMEVKNILTSKNSSQALKEILENKKINYKENINDKEVKDYLSTYVLTEIFNPKNVNILIYQIKLDNIIIYENTMLFKSIRVLPEFMILNIIKKSN